MSVPSLKVNLLIIGAGPFGLSMAAYAKHLGIDHVIVGNPMEFWSKNMPRDMYLRSASDWHLDPLGIHTIAKFLETQDLKPADVEPLSLSFYLSYAQWFQNLAQIKVLPLLIRRLDSTIGDDHRFQATTDDGQTIKAHNVVIANPSISATSAAVCVFWISVESSSLLLSGTRRNYSSVADQYEPLLFTYDGVGSSRKGNYKMLWFVNPFSKPIFEVEIGTL